MPIGAVFPLVAVLLFSVSGCAGKDREEKREYAVPESLCDLTVGAEVIAPFMPPGKKVHQSEDGGPGSIWSCEISVDGEEVLRVAREVWEPGWSARRFASSQAYVEPEHEAADKSYVYSDRGAVTVLRCTAKGEKWDLFLKAKARNEGVADAKAMEKLITTYRTELEKRDPCADI
ncbi:hypothetical protein GCM10010420_51310 [Streptomyces glaucosporus]|uniref:DUF3558 domain-containing protein n=2 Tax=Streptomyces glaucosporus TaxID=284044 RepID=A0ABN3IW49_9ACTN